MKKKLDLFARLTRRRIRRWQAMLRWRTLSPGSSPILFANSFPKSGTHLLTQVMHGFCGFGFAVEAGLPAVVTFDGLTGRQRSPAEILNDLKRLLPGDIAYGHVHSFPEAVNFLCQEGIAGYFILRDPRDVAVSHVHYIAEMAPGHILHRYYHEILPGFDERLEASVAGVPLEFLSSAGGLASEQPLPDIRSRFEPFLGWLDHHEVLVLRYEDFITDRHAAVVKVLDHAIERGFEPRYDRSEAIRLLVASIDPAHSPTFRSGKVGGWRSAFNPEHIRLFKQTTGDLLIHLGYETSLDW